MTAKVAKVIAKDAMNIEQTLCELCGFSTLRSLRLIPTL